MVAGSCSLDLGGLLGKGGEVWLGGATVRVRIITKFNEFRVLLLQSLLC
jgi:hypothetical protein